jgi:hypothetical protein
MTTFDVTASAMIIITNVYNRCEVAHVYINGLYRPCETAALDGASTPDLNAVRCNVHMLPDIFFNILLNLMPSSSEMITHVWSVRNGGQGIAAARGRCTRLVRCARFHVCRLCGFEFIGSNFGVFLMGKINGRTSEYTLPLLL